MDALYTAEALSTGAGRNGHVATKDGVIDTDVRVPVEMGGPGGAPNPEDFFAAGYAACFHSALQGVARAQKVTLEDTTVGSRVHLVGDGKGGYQLAVALEVVIPTLPHEQAQQLADAAHQICPYSNATRGNIEVTVTVSDD
ncbi:organic hydroperoxide resistance protein [Microbacterium sp. RD1]|uniref:organic hydroperoxide resistance protein n=1 Tax=Microbacterium sp. RD1 TaxID=3457313 RepID=UPI003FA528D4